MNDHVAKMIYFLQLRNLDPQTIYRYRRDAEHFLRFFPKVPPRELGTDQVGAYLLHLRLEQGLSPNTVKHTLASLRNFFKLGLDRSDALAAIPWPKLPKTLPDIWSDEELAALFAATEGIRYRTILCTLYATGTRLSEACHLQVHDIDRARRVIHIRGGKGKKDRFIPLSPGLLRCLETYWRAIRPPQPYLFPGEKSGRPIRNKMVEGAMAEAVVRCRVQKRATPHTLRHCYATRCLEQGMDLHTLQMILGHASIQTTQLYLHLSLRHIAQVCSPFDLLAGIPASGPEVKR